MTYAVATVLVIAAWAFVAASDAIRERRSRRVAQEAAETRERWRRGQRLKARRLDEFACWRRFKAGAPEPSSSDGE